MVKPINVKINEYQAEKIRASGLNCSEYVRRAIDYYNEDVREQVLTEIINFCKGEIKKSKVGVKNSKASVKICKESPQKIGEKTVENKEYLYEDKEKLYDNKEYLYEDKEKLYDSKEKSGNIVIQKLRDKFPMLQRLLNNPENLNSIPDVTLKVLTKEKNISKKSIEDFIELYKEELKDGKFEEIV